MRNERGFGVEKNPGKKLLVFGASHRLNGRIEAVFLVTVVGFVERFVPFRLVSFRLVTHRFVSRVAKQNIRSIDVSASSL